MLAAFTLTALWGNLQAQRVDVPRADADAVSTADPSKVFLDAFTSVQQGEKLEEDGKLRPALAKYRYAASLLEQLSQTNPNWQPLIIRYRVRKTTDNIRKLEDKLALQPSPESSSVQPRTNAAGQPSDDDDLPVQDNPVDANGRAMLPAPPVRDEEINRSTMELSAKFAHSQQDLKAAQDALVTANKRLAEDVRQKQELEFQLHSYQSSANIVSRRLEHYKTDRADLEKELDKAQARLKEALVKNPDATEARKELRDQIATLQKSLAKSKGEAADAQKERDAVNAKLTDAEKRNLQITQERDKALAQTETTKDTADKIQSLQNENEALNQKLAAAEASITQLTTEAVKKKEELEGMVRELSTVKDQLATTRDQQDRSETTITELQQKLEGDAKQMADLKAKGTSSEDLARMTSENNLLKGIVMRQLKADAVRANSRKLVSDELARLEVQSNVLNEQIEQLGRPTVQLTDDERNLFKEPVVEVSDADPSVLAAKITAVKPKGSNDSPIPADTTVAASPSTPTNPDAPSTPGQAAEATPEANDGPKVAVNPKPNVSEELQPLAIQAEESFHRGRYPEAEDAYKKLLARDPKNPYLLSNQGVVLFRQNKLKSAEVDLKKAVAFDPKDAFSLSTLGIVYYRMHQYDNAIACLTQAIQLDPKNATAHNYLGITSSQKGWLEAALAELQKAIALNPKYADAHFNIAVIYATSQPPSKDQAQEHYDTAVALGAAPDPALEKLIGKK